MVAAVCVVFALGMIILKECLGNFTPPAVLNLGIFADKFTTSSHVNIQGIHTISAIILAIKEINNKSDRIFDHLLPNTTLKFALRETHDDYLKASLAAQDFSLKVFNGSGVIGAIGTGYDTASKAIGQTFANTKFHINNVDYFANASELSHKATFPYTTRVVPSRGYGGRMLAKLTKLYFGWNVVSVFSTSDSYGSDVASEFFAEATLQGIHIENKFTFWPGATDFDSIIKETLSNGILEVFVLLMESADAGALLEAGYNAGLFRVGTQILGCQFVTKPLAWQSMSASAPVEDIMKGIISVVPVQNRNTTAYRSFLRRYLAQNSTKTTDLDGTIHCSLDKDDDGGTHLYVSDDGSAVQKCAGVDFSELSSSGEDLEDAVAFAYDAVFAMALALHNTYYTKRLKNPTGDDISASLLKSVHFTGATGLVDFYEGQGGTEGYASGDRQSGLLYKVLNFHPLFYHKNSKTPSQAVRTIGYWDNDRNVFLACDRANDDYCTPAVFNTADGLPVDGLPNIIEVQLAEWARNLIRVGAALSILTVLIYLFIWQLFSDTKLIRATQPTVMYIVLLGGTLGGIQLFLQTMDVSDTTCMASMWMAHLAFALVFAALVSRTWRISKIVNSGFNKVKVTADHMYNFMGVALGFFLLMLVIDSIVGRPHKSYDEHFDGHNSVRLMKCETDNPSVTQALFAIEGIVLFYGAKLCWDTKDAPGSVNESTSISLALYLILFVCAVTFPIVFLSIDPTPQNLTLVMSSGYMFCVVCVVHILFARKALLVMEGAEVDANLNIIKSTVPIGSVGQRVAKVTSSVVRKVQSRVKSSTPHLDNSSNEIPEKSKLPPSPGRGRTDVKSVGVPCQSPSAREAPSLARVWAADKEVLDGSCKTPVLHKECLPMEREQSQFQRPESSIPDRNSVRPFTEHKD